jgi:hypothetical protein
LGSEIVTVVNTLLLDVTLYNKQIRHFDLKSATLIFYELICK